MSNSLKKVRKLLRDPLLFVADSKLLRGRFDEVFAKRRAQNRTVSGESYFGNVNLRGGIDFVVYFPSGMPFNYQVEQWLPALETLSKSHSVVILTRSKGVHRHFLKATNLLGCYCRTLDDLISFYEDTDVRCVLYVNNAQRNFQSLIWHRSMHVHINHGESEKSCMYSNQAKAYDYVFVVATAGLERYKKHLLKMDESAFIQVGRPQLDNVKPIVHPIPAGRRVVLYAPTWSASHTAMNYSSIAAHGATIARSFVGNSKYYFIYRPHPSVGTVSEEERLSHEEINTMIDAADNAAQIMNCDINQIFPRVDVAIMDNSSVVIDYLRADKPFLMTDLLLKRTKGKPPRIAKAARIIGAKDYAQLEAIVDEQIAQDPNRDRRLGVREHYLGTYQEGEATQAFISRLEGILEERERRQLALGH